MTIHEIAVDTPVGTLRLFATPEALVRLHLPASKSPIALGDTAGPPPGSHPVLDRARAQLEAYLAGQLETFDLPLAPQGTEFQRAVWRALSAIPFGVTRSYGELAATVGRPTASRAVGAANGQNPIAIIVPCHRVIGADGSLTGFGGGLPCKEWLLSHERRIRSQRRSGDMAETDPTPRQRTLWA